MYKGVGDKLDKLMISFNSFTYLPKRRIVFISLKFCVASRMTIREKAVWPDGYIIFQYWAIYRNGNSPKSIKIYQRWFKILHKTNLSFQKLPKDLQNIAKLAKFRQIWSQCCKPCFRKVRPWKMFFMLLYSSQDVTSRLILTQSCVKVLKDHPF